MPQRPPLLKLLELNESEGARVCSRSLFMWCGMPPLRDAQTRNLWTSLDLPRLNADTDALATGSPKDEEALGAIALAQWRRSKAMLPF
jgi:hypothetical protein